MTTDTSEKGLETLIMRHMTGEDGFTVVARGDSHNGCCPERTRNEARHDQVMESSPSAHVYG